MAPTAPIQSPGTGMRQRLERWLHGVWYEGASGGWVLAPLAALYRLVIFVRGLLYRHGWRHRYRAAVPVIVVGNITAGGVGKTPFVVWLVETLQRLGYSPGVVSRGYGGSLADTTLVTGSHRADETGDEALMMARRLSVPVVIGTRRAASVALLERLGVDIVVADDGLQHYAMQRNIEVCVVDEQRKFGNGRLLPAGPLREPLSRLETVDVIVHHRQALGDGLSGMALGNARLRHLCDGSVSPLSSMAGRTVHAVAGVGNPERFFGSLERAGITIITHAFADHYRFASGDLEFDDRLPVLMTDKDAVKCEEFAQPDVFAVSVDALVSDDIERAILDRLKAPGAPQPE